MMTSTTKIRLAGILAGALSAAVVGFAGPAQADDGGWGFGGPRHDSGWHHGYGREDSNSPWLDDLVPTVKVPHVDTSVRN
ncbi:hypothetical protein FHR72_000591 [Mycolicibacterium iranicum]|uniref:Sulfur globule protein n=1 Tax=Mycolicibacterium iranicum TaxID=912594 RepID=A0A839Q2I3_MYCIR|nr:hypothetical protein [Mycolicibacterium iranicum]MBB2989134.1 hypothetical protein [Mycolicibacterium iranicum]